MLQISHFIRAPAFPIRAPAFRTLGGRLFILRVLKQTQKLIFLEGSMLPFKGSILPQREPWPQRVARFLCARRVAHAIPARETERNLEIGGVNPWVL